MSLEIFDMDQGSPEWFEVRCGVVTASCFKDVMTGGVGGKPSVTRLSYMMKIAGERIRQQPTDAFSTEHMERGKEYEEHVRELYQEKTGKEVKKIGFMKNGNIGASADGLVDDNIVVEFKTRLPHIQIKLLLDNAIPKENYHQAQGNLLVSERKKIDYVSFCPGLPLSVISAERDEEYLAKLSAALVLFDKEADEMVNKILGMF